MKQRAALRSLGRMALAGALFLTIASAQMPPAAPGAANYILQPGVFPPIGSEVRVRGQLVEADYIHRTGQYRAADSGQLVSFSLTPFAVLLYHGAEADLRDIPLETNFTFFMYRDAAGALSRVGAVQDDVSLTSRAGKALRVQSIAPAGDQPGARKLVVVTHPAGDAANTQPSDPGQQELIATDQTHIWKDSQPGKLDDLQPNSEIWVDIVGSHQHCGDIFIGAPALQGAIDRQRKIHDEFIRLRGLAGWIDRVDGKHVIVTLFGDPVGQRAFYKDQQIVFDKWAAEHTRVDMVVANQELRTYNPPVDGQASNIMGFESVPTDNYGCTGVRLTIQANLLLEGFRHGHIVRIFAPGWPVDDMPFGEKVYDEDNGQMAEASPNQYPFRTDFGNEELPWFQYVPGRFVPHGAEHAIGGELLAIDPVHRTGKFKTDVTGDVVDFTMPATATVRYLGADAELTDLPIGTRYRFSMLLDGAGKFTRAMQISDDFSCMRVDQLTRRVEIASDGNTPFFLASSLPARKDYKFHMIQPPDVGQGEFVIDSKTVITKGDQHPAAKDLAVGDLLMMNQSGVSPTSRGRVTQAWVGEAAQKAATDQQRAKHAADLKQNGMPAMVERIEGNTIVINFLADNRRDFQQFLGDDPRGKPIFAKRADEALQPVNGDILQFSMLDHLHEGPTFDTFGSSGIRWELETKALPTDLKPGMILRIFKEGSPPPGAAIGH